MDLKLNIYENGTVKKTYTQNQYDITFGTIENFIALIDLDKFENVDDVTFISTIAKTVIKGFGEIKELLKDVFPGLTDEDLRQAKTKEIIPIVVDIVKYTFSELSLLGDNSKN